MNSHFQSLLLKTTGAKSFYQIEIIQSLWSGYGKIVRYGLEGCPIKSVVVKHVNLTHLSQHPRGWGTDLSHQRKLKSYQVEMAWYKQWSTYCHQSCRVPKCFALEALNNEMFMVLEDLNAIGFPDIRTEVTDNEIRTCLSWLANFHATFLAYQPDNLWPIGTYWHLDTRPDELQALNDTSLKNAAYLIDQKLRDSPYQTFVHGDAKLANFCFSEDGKQVAAVDFQYVGGGCGIKDVAYFMGSCLDENQCQHYEAELLDYYFNALRSAIISHNKSINIDDLEQDWRNLFAFAWTDFHRFLKGWSPGHWKINSYSEHLSRQVIAELKQQ